VGLGVGGRREAVRDVKGIKGVRRARGNLGIALYAGKKSVAATRGLNVWARYRQAVARVKDGSDDCDAPGAVPVDERVEGEEATAARPRLVRIENWGWPGPRCLLPTRACRYLPLMSQMSSTPPSRFRRRWTMARKHTTTTSVGKQDTSLHALLISHHCLGLERGTK
jgi:hypothetical protein